MNSGRHLTYDELIQNMVNSADLADLRQTHLQACHQCRDQAAAIERRFHRLGQVARELAPRPSRAFRAPEATVQRRRRQFRPAMAMGLAGAVILAITIFWSSGFDPAQSPWQMASRSPDEDKQLMAQVDELIKDALPQPYQRMLAVSEPILTEDLIDWIVPPIEEDKDAEPQA